MGIGRPWGQKTGNLKLIDLKEASPLGHTRLTCVRLSYRSLDTPCRKMCLAARSASAGNGQGGDAHAIYIDGILIRASNLVNGVTIMADAKPDALSLTYFHIELDTHEPSWRKVWPSRAISATTYMRSTMQTSISACTAQPESRPFAPIVRYHSSLQELGSHIRSTVAPSCDFRKPIEKGP